MVLGAASLDISVTAPVGPPFRWAVLFVGVRVAGLGNSWFRRWEVSRLPASSHYPRSFFSFSRSTEKARSFFPIRRKSLRAEVYSLNSTDASAHNRHIRRR